MVSRPLAIATCLFASLAASAQTEAANTVDAPAAILPNTCPQQVLLSPMVPAPTYVDVTFVISANGVFKSAALLRSSGDSYYDLDVLNSIGKCKFALPLLAGKPVEGIGRLVVHAIPRPVHLQTKPYIPNMRDCVPTADDYPQESRRLNEQGTTRLGFTISPTGELMAAAIQKSSNFPRLDEIALTKLRKCVFAPGRAPDGKPIESKYEVDYVWKLQ